MMNGGIAQLFVTYPVLIPTSSKEPTFIKKNALERGIQSIVNIV